MMLACGGEGGGRDGDGAGSAVTKGDNLGESETDATSGGDVLDSDHRAAVLECDAVADHIREHLSATRVDAILDLERDRNDCLVSANDAVIGTIEAVLTASGDPYAGQGQPAWKGHRSAAIAVCNVVVEAHADAATGALAAVAATCIGDIEAQLGALVDAHADLGVAPFSIPAARDRYPSCYAAFDDEVANAPGTDLVSEAAAASDGLSACIREAHDAVLPELAARVAATFPGRDAAQIESDMQAMMGGLADARQRVCEVVVHAGPGRDAGGFLAVIADCAVDAAIASGETIDLVAPGLLDGEVPDDTTGDGTESGSTG